MTLGSPGCQDALSPSLTSGLIAVIDWLLSNIHCAFNGSNPLFAATRLKAKGKSLLATGNIASALSLPAITRDVVSGIKGGVAILSIGMVAFGSRVRSWQMNWIVLSTRFAFSEAPLASFV